MLPNFTMASCASMVEIWKASPGTRRPRSVLGDEDGVVWMIQMGVTYRFIACYNRGFGFEDLDLV